MLFFGQELFDLYFTPDTPFYATESWVAENPEFTLYAPTNKCYLYTMVF
jgi:hypothetical protein